MKQKRHENNLIYEDKETWNKKHSIYKLNKRKYINILARSMNEHVLIAHTQGRVQVGRIY
jgi:hypothetical protein